MILKPAYWWLLTAAAAAASQAAVLQSFTRFASEAASWRSSQLADRRAGTQARIEAARAVGLYSYNGYALFRLAAGDFAAAGAPDRRSNSAPSLQSALKYMPHRPNVLALSGENLYRLGDFQGSARVMDQLFRMRPRPEGNAAYLNLIRASAHFRSDDPGGAVVPITAASQFAGNRAALAVPRLLNSTGLNQPLSTEAAAASLLFAGEGGLADWKQIQALFAAAESAGKLPELAASLRNALARSAAPASKLRIQLDLKTGRRHSAAAAAQALEAAAPGDPDLPQIRKEFGPDGYKTQESASTGGSESAFGQPSAN